MKNFILVLSTILFSASVSFSQFNISGKVINEKNFPVSGVMISASGGGQAVSGKAGEFTITVPSKPYNIFLIDESTQTSVLYENISTENPELNMFGVFNSPNTFIEPLKITFPAVPSGKSAIIKFVSEDTFFSKEINAVAGETTKLITIEWPNTSSNLNGKVIYLEKDARNFTRFGEKTLTMQSQNANQSINFSEEDLDRSPGFSTINISFPILKYDIKGYEVFADFLAFNRNSEFLISKNDGNIVSTRVLVPASLPFSYRLKIRGYGFSGNGSGFENIVYAYPGTSYNLDEQSPPLLQAPQDRVIGYNENTQFAFDPGSGAGIYVIHFMGFFPEGNYYVVTSRRNFTNPIQNSGGVLEGNEYKWKVRKYSPYSSVDDFVKPKTFSNDMGARSITTSTERTFRINAY